MFRHFVCLMAEARSLSSMTSCCSYLYIAVCWKWKLILKADNVFRDKQNKFVDAG